MGSDAQPKEPIPPGTIIGSAQMDVPAKEPKIVVFRAHVLEADGTIDIRLPTAEDITDAMVTAGAKALRDQGSIPPGAENFIHPQHRVDARAVIEAVFRGD